MRIARQGNHVKDRVAPVNVGLAEQVPAAAPNEAYLVVKVEIAGDGRRDRGEAGAAQGLGAGIDDGLLVDDLGGAGPGGGQFLVELAPVEVVQGPGRDGTAQGGPLAIGGSRSAALLEPFHGSLVVLLHHAQVGGVDAGAKSGTAAHLGSAWWRCLSQRLVRLFLFGKLSEGGGLVS